MACERVNILCVGNALHGDDGLGEAVFDALGAQTLPAGVRVFRVPFVGLEALSGFEHCDRVLVVDALSGYGEPGSVHVLDPGAVVDEAAPVGHGAGLGYWLAQLSGWLDPLPEVEVVGVEMAQARPFVPGLSAPVRAALPAVCQRLHERMAAHA